MYKSFLIESKNKDVFTKWWDNNPDKDHFDWVQEFIKDLGRDTINQYNGDVFKAMEATMDSRQISMIIKDIEKMKKGNTVKY